MALYNIVCAITETLGTADVVIGAAVSGYKSFADVPNGAVVSYGIRERESAHSEVEQSEVGIGVWNSATSTLSRTVTDSTNAGSKIVLATGYAEVYITPLAADFHNPVTIGTANGLSLAAQALSLGLASAGVTGALSGTDWSAFNNKQAALGFTPPPNTRLISTTAPLAGGGDLSANRTLTITQAGAAQDGYLSSTDWNTFNNKQNALGFTPVDSASASWIDLTDGGATTLHSHAGGGGDISGTGVVGQVAEFVTNTKTLQAAKLIGPATNILTITNAAASTLALNITSAKTLTLTAADNYTLTVPATGTAALLATANVFTTTQMIDSSADAIELRLQAHSSKTTDYLRVEDSASTVLTRIGKNGELDVTVNANISPGLIVQRASSTIFFYVGGAGDSHFFTGINVGSSNGALLSLTGNIARNAAADSNVSILKLSASINPTSGTSEHFGLNFEPNINQTGTATGNVTLFRMNPTLTSLAGTLKFFEFIDGANTVFEIGQKGNTKINQASTTAAVPPLWLRQADLSEEFMRIESTVGAGNPIDTAGLGAYYGKMRVYVEGVGQKWLALYD